MADNKQPTSPEDRITLEATAPDILGPDKEDKPEKGVPTPETKKLKQEAKPRSRRGVSSLVSCANKETAHVF